MTGSSEGTLRVGKDFALNAQCEIPLPYHLLLAPRKKKVLLMSLDNMWKIFHLGSFLEKKKNITVHIDTSSPDMFL